MMVKKILPDCFHLPYCDESEKKFRFLNSCQHLSHIHLVTCNYCQNDFKTLCDREVRCSACCWSIERNLKNYTLEDSIKIANV